MVIKRCPLHCLRCLKSCLSYHFVKLIPPTVAKMFIFRQRNSKSMLSAAEIQQLQSENYLLQVQLEDINEIINIREEELEILRKKAEENVLLQSTLSGNLEQISQMQQLIGEQQRQAAGSAKREASMENEIVQSVEMEKEFYTIREKLESSKAALHDLETEISDTAGLYKQLAEANSRIAELESNLEIALMENGFLKDDLIELGRKIAAQPVT